MYPELKLFFLNLKKLFRGKDGELSLVGRLAAGACAGMTSTFVSNAFVLWHFWFMSVFLLSLKWFFWVVFLGTLEPRILLMKSTSWMVFFIFLPSCRSSNLFSFYLLCGTIQRYTIFLHVGNIPVGCPEVTLSSWTRVPNYVWGMTYLIMLFMIGCPYLHEDEFFNVFFPDCLKHAKRGRSCIFLLWSWTFSYWNSSIYCCELLHFWLVSPLLPLSMLH